MFVRSLWIGGALALGAWAWALWAGHLWGWREWLLLAGVAHTLQFVALALRPIAWPRLARRLDRGLGLRDQVTAAHEVAARGPHSYMEAHLLAQTERALDAARRRFARQARLPWSDLEWLAAVGVGAVGLHLWMLAAALAPLPSPGTALYEPLPPMAAEPAVSLPGVPPEQQQPSGGTAEAQATASDPADLGEAAAAQEALDTLAAALATQSLTQSAAAALSEGDVEQAAADLRALAENAGELSPEARQDLAEALEQAAGDLEGLAPDAAQQLAAAAGQLAQAGGAEPQQEAGTEAMESLARLLEELDAARSHAASEANTAGQADSGQGEAGTVGGEPGAAGTEQTSGAGSESEGNAQSEGAGTGGSAWGGEAANTGSLDAFDGEAERVELPTGDSLDPGRLQPAGEPTGENAAERQLSYTYTTASGAGGEQVDDPLRVPWRLRDVIRRYFTWR